VRTPAVSNESLTVNGTPPGDGRRAISRGLLRQHGDETR
jgi:hypothetical protein